MIKKIIFFLILTISVFSQGNTDTVKLFEEKKYKEILKIYEQEGRDTEEFNIILVKAVTKKNIEALKILKNIEGFEEEFINYLLYLDNAELLTYYQKNNFLKPDAFSYEKLSFQAAETESKNILGEIIKNRKEVNIFQNGTSLLQYVYNYSSSEIFTIIVEKIDKIEKFSIIDENNGWDSYYGEKDEYLKKIDVMVKLDEKKKFLNEKTKNEIFCYYLNTDELYKALNILEKYKEIKTNKEANEHLLILAGVKKDYKLVEKMIKEGVEVSGNAFNSNDFIVEFIMDEKVEKILVENSKDVEFFISVAIGKFIEENKFDEIEKLLKSTYKINKDSIGAFAVNKAIISGNIEALKFLKKHDLLKDELDKDSIWNILELNKINVFEYLLNNFENTEELTKINSLVSNNRIQMLELLINNEKNLVKQKGIEYKIFYYAMLSQNKEIIEYLLSKGFDINQKDHYGKTPLYYAIEMASVGDSYEEKYEIIKLLKEKGADFNRVANKKSALIFAVEKSYGEYGMNKELVEELLNLNVDVNYKDEKGYTAYDYVKQFNYEELDKIFKRYNK